MNGVAGHAVTGGCGGMGPRVAGSGVCGSKKWGRGVGSEAQSRVARKERKIEALTLKLDT